jgi:hypothetical protein
MLQKKDFFESLTEIFKLKLPGEKDYILEKTKEGQEEYSDLETCKMRIISTFSLFIKYLSVANKSFKSIGNFFEENIAKCYEFLMKECSHNPHTCRFLSNQNELWMVAFSFFTVLLQIDSSHFDLEEMKNFTKNCLLLILNFDPFLLELMKIDPQQFNKRVFSLVYNQVS